jgi:FkbM family methyltransferase
MNRKKNNIYIILFLIVIVILLIYLFKKTIKENYINPNDYEYYDEKNNKINHSEVEYTEQYQADKYIEPNSVVLELGARYGTVSCVINRKINNKNNQVSVEPDSAVWDALEKNMKLNNTNFNIVKGFISSTPMELEGEGYSLSYKDVDTSNIKNIKLTDIETQYNLKFDTLVADCEGCIERLFDENPKLYQELKLIIMEEDQPHKCHYDKIKYELNKNGFKLIESDSNGVARSVWKKD